MKDLTNEERFILENVYIPEEKQIDLLEGALNKCIFDTENKTYSHFIYSVAYSEIQILGCPHWFSLSVLDFVEYYNLRYRFNDMLKRARVYYRECGYDE